MMFPSDSSVGKRAFRRRLIMWLGLSVLTATAIFVLFSHHQGYPKISSNTKRYVSLSPAITETLVALGVGAQLVGVSDYCHYPKRVENISHVGSGFTPRYEAIIALAPTTVFVESVNAANTESLAGVVNVEPLPWLTLDQVIQSTRRLGQLPIKDRPPSGWQETTNPATIQSLAGVAAHIAHDGPGSG